MASQGAIFAKVIDEVIESCQNDFEEGGVEPGTLEELKKVRGRFSFRLVHCGIRQEHFCDMRASNSRLRIQGIHQNHKPCITSKYLVCVESDFGRSQAKAGLQTVRRFGGVAVFGYLGQPFYFRALPLARRLAPCPLTNAYPLGTF